MTTDGGGLNDGGDDGDGDNAASNASDALGQDAYLWALQHDPSLTGLSSPLVLPTTVAGFDGMSFLDSVNGFVPPDTSIAVGPTAVVEVVNSQIQFYNKTTGTSLLPNTPLNTFFGQPSELPIEPVATYDDIAGRFIVSSNERVGRPPAGRLQGFQPARRLHLLRPQRQRGGLLPGFPAGRLQQRRGGDRREHVPGAGEFPRPGPLLRHQHLFASTPPSTLTLGTNYFSYDRTSGDFSLVPATMHGSKPGDPMYFVEENSYEDGSNLRVVSATKLLSASPSFTDTIVGVAAYTAPPSAQQPGGTIPTLDSRILNVDYRDGLLVAGQNVGLSTDTDAHARWYELSVSGTPSLVQQGTIAPAPGVSTYFPAIAIGAGDVIGMTYNQSSASQYPSVYDTGRTPADLKTTMETPVLAHAGPPPIRTSPAVTGAITAALPTTRRPPVPSGAAPSIRRRTSRDIRPTGPPGSLSSRSRPR